MNYEVCVLLPKTTKNGFYTKKKPKSCFQGWSFDFIKKAIKFLENL